MTAAEAAERNATDMDRSRDRSREVLLILYDSSRSSRDELHSQGV